jgi:hypothetical protein
MEAHKILVLFSLALICILIGHICLTTQHNEDVATQLRVDGFKVVSGSSDSPTVTQTTSNYSEFIQIVRDVNATVIFNLGIDNGFLVVANETYGCKYYP